MMERPACSHDCDLSLSMYQNYDTQIYCLWQYTVCPIHTCNMCKDVWEPCENKSYKVL
jgi:hypothetical protein